MSRNLTIPTVIRELDRVSKERLGVNVFDDDVPVSKLVRDLAVQHAFAEVPEIAGQLNIEDATEDDE